MKSLARRLGIIAALAVGVFALLLVGRLWSVSQHPLQPDRAALYARAVDQVSAGTAGPGAASRFRLILPFDTPPEQRPRGAPAEAFIGTGPAILSCPLSAAELRRLGPGQCTAALVGFDEPAVCEFIACLVVEVPSAFLQDPGTRAALTGGELRKRVCEMREPPGPMGWRRDSTGLADCGPLWFTRGVIVLAERTGEHDYRYRFLL